MTVSPRFGRLLTASAVSAAVKAHLEAWLVPFLAEVERQLELDPRSIAAPRSWDIVSEFGKFDASSLPAVVIAVDEVQGDPARYGDGSYNATFPVGVAVVTGGRTPQETERNAMAYGAAIRGAMLYRFDWARTLGAAGVKWVGETYAEVDSTDRRTKSAALILLDIVVEDVARDYLGAALGTTPPEDPYVAPEAIATADTVITTIVGLAP